MNKNIEHSERDHAALSPSASKRWLNCPWSVKASEGLIQGSSPAAEEGTKAHELAEYNLNLYLDGKLEFGSDADYQIVPIPNTHPSGEMLELIRDYITLVIGEYESGGWERMELEQRIDMSFLVEGMFGSGDVVLIKQGAVHIIDLKFGRMKVESADNSQMKLYGLGVAHANLDMNPTTVSMTIGQPRLGSFETVTEPLETLLEWADTVVVPQAKKALNGNKEVKAGSWCVFCPLAGACKARMRHVIGDFEETPDFNTISRDEAAIILSKLDDLKRWSDAFQAYELKKAMAGDPATGFMVGQTRSMRKIRDVSRAIGVLVSEGYKVDQLTSTKLVTLSELERLVGKTKLAETLGNLIEVSTPNPKLVMSHPDTVSYAKSVISDFD